MLTGSRQALWSKEEKEAWIPYGVRHPFLCPRELLQSSHTHLDPSGI